MLLMIQQLHTMIHNATHDTTITYNKGMIHNVTHDTTITYQRMIHNATHDTTITYQRMIHNAILMIQQLRNDS